MAVLGGTFIRHAASRRTANSDRNESSCACATKLVSACSLYEAPTLGKPRRTWWSCRGPTLSQTCHQPVLLSLIRKVILFFKAEQAFESDFSQFLSRHTHGCQSRVSKSTEFYVIVANDRKIVRHMQSKLIGGLQRSKSAQVVRADQGGHLRVCFQQMTCCGVPSSHAVVTLEDRS